MHFPSQNSQLIVLSICSVSIITVYFKTSRHRLLFRNLTSCRDGKSRPLSIAKKPSTDFDPRPTNQPPQTVSLRLVLNPQARLTRHRPPPSIDLDQSNAKSLNDGKKAQLLTDNVVYLLTLYVCPNKHTYTNACLCLWEFPEKQSFQRKRRKQDWGKIGAQFRGKERKNTQQTSTIHSFEVRWSRVAGWESNWEVSELETSNRWGSCRDGNVRLISRAVEAVEIRLELQSAISCSSTNHVGIKQFWSFFFC